MYHLKHQMAQQYLRLNSTLKNLSNDTSHAQICVKMKKLWPRQVGEEKQAANHRLCRDKAKNFVMTNPDYVEPKLEDKLCRNKVFYVATKPKKNFVATKNFLSQQQFLCRNKVFLLQQRFFCCNKDFLLQQSFFLS